MLDRMKAVAQELLKCEDASNAQLSFHVPPWNSVGEALYTRWCFFGDAQTTPALRVVLAYLCVCTYHARLEVYFYEGGGHVRGGISRTHIQTLLSTLSNDVPPRVLLLYILVARKGG